jgi:NADH-quinone oxidoreductase subunit N
MTSADLTSLLPELILCAGGVLILLADALLPGLRRAWTVLALATTAVAGWGVWQAWTDLSATGAGAASNGDAFFVFRSCNGFLETSRITVAFSAVILIATALCVLASDNYLRRERLQGGEYFALLLWCATGMLLMLRATELLTIFLSLELLSISLYALAAYHRRLSVAVEAAIKYFLMGAFVSAFVLLGIAFLYGAAGSTRLEVIAHVFAGGHAGVLATLGLLLLLCGFGFKMSLVPFHAWSPDTYQGAPSPFVAFLSVAPKAPARWCSSGCWRWRPRAPPRRAGSTWWGSSRRCPWWSGTSWLWRRPT